jgi:hypothetical protein
MHARHDQFEFTSECTIATRPSLMTECTCKNNDDEVDCTSTTTYGSQRSPLDKEHANDVHCRFAGLEVESKEVGDKAYVGISISPNEHFERRKDLADYEDDPPVRKWYEEGAPEEFEELWSGVCEDDEMLEIHLVRSEIGVESAEVYKYKPVGKKVHPVPGVFQEASKVRRQIPEDPLSTLPEVSTHPPDFVPTERFTLERMKEMGLDENAYLLPEERKLFQQVLRQNKHAITWPGELPGKFRSDYFSPYIFPVVAHEPWARKQIPIPPGLFDKYIELLKERIRIGLYEPSQSSYRSTYFCVQKKNGALRMVHDLQPLNAVSIRDASVPPILDEFVESFAGRKIYTVLDIHGGYDQRELDESSRDMTTFHTPLGPHRLTRLPQGYTNAVADYQNTMSFLLQDEIPDVAGVFIDDVGIKGDLVPLDDMTWKDERIAANPGIQSFVWKHAQDVNRVFHRVACAGGTFSAKKTQIAMPEVLIVGQLCTTQGRVPDEGKVAKILKWPVPETVTQVRGFLGLCGTLRIWIPNYSLRVRPLVKLTKKDTELVWEDEQQRAFDDMKLCVTNAPVLRPLDYRSGRPIVLSVDTSYIAIGYILSQEDETGRKHPARYGSLPINDRESRYSQAKLELYGLYRALRDCKYWIAGVTNLKVELDAKYVPGMIRAPDIQPSAAENRWIQGILRYDFEVIHVPGERHKGPDALSRRPPTESELEEAEIIDSDDDMVALVRSALVLQTNRSNRREQIETL